MKKLSCMLLALILILTTAVPAFAYTNSSDADGDGEVMHYGIHQINPEDFIEASPIATVSARSGTLSFSFAGANKDEVYTDFVEFYFSSGSTATLHVTACTWMPENYPLEIGIYNWSTAENWYYTKYNGNYNGYLFFSGLTSGQYSVYVRNKGTSTIQSGYISYSLS